MSKKFLFDENRKGTLRVVVGSDICPTQKDFDFFVQGNVDAILPSEYLSLFRGSDFSIVNVECPLTEVVVPIPKVGPALKASPQTINFYRTLGTTAVCLANNHILDYGEEGVRETIAVFASAGIKVVGAGMNLDAARAPLIKRFPCGRSLAVVAMAESEFCIASKDSFGANPIDYQNYTLISKLKKDSDKVLVVLHAGTEMRRIPRPGLIDLCHFLVDQGADAVIVQHTHCVGGVEYYNNVPIVYGQGNFIFGKLRQNELKSSLWWEGMLIEMVWDTVSNDWTLQLHPFQQRSEDVGIRSLTDDEEVEFLKRQEDFSLLIQDREAVENSWKEFCLKSKNSVLLNLMGASRITRSFACRGLPLAKLWLRLSNYRLVRNMISCESHRELALTVLSAVSRLSDRNNNK